MPERGAWQQTRIHEAVRDSHASTRERTMIIGKACGTGPSSRCSSWTRLFWLLAVALLVAGSSWAQAPGTWEPGADLNQARAGHTATLMANGKVLIAGGKDASGTPLATAEIYDPTTGHYTRLTPTLPTAVYGHTATALSDGTVLLAGGNDASGQPVRDAQLYDLLANKFTALSPMSKARSHHTASPMADGMVLIAGGTDGVAALSTLEVYDPVRLPTGRLRGGDAL